MSITVPGPACTGTVPHVIYRYCTVFIQVVWKKYTCTGNMSVETGPGNSIVMILLLEM